MIRSFRSSELEKLWKAGRALRFKTIDTQQILDCLDVVDSAREPHDAAFTGFRFDEWTEGGSKRFGVMVSNHWLISFEWSDGDAIGVDLEHLT